MSSRIAEHVAKKQRRAAQDPQTCEELILDGLKLRVLSIEDAAEIARYPNLKSLSLNQCSLSDISNLPPLAQLESLELHDNKLGGGSVLEVIAKRCPALQTLYMAGNRVRTLEELLPLKAMAALKELDIEMNPVVGDENAPEARARIFNAFPHLTIVNGYMRNGQEVVEEQSVDEEEEDASSFCDDDPQSKRRTTLPLTADASVGKPSLLASLIHTDFADEDDEDDEDYHPDSEEEVYDSEEEDDEEDDDDADTPPNERKRELDADSPSVKRIKEAT